MLKKKKVFRNIFITLVCIIGALWAFRQINLERNKIRLGPPEEYIQACNAPIRDKIDTPYIFTGEVKEIYRDTLSENMFAKIIVQKVYKKKDMDWLIAGAEILIPTSVNDHDTKIRVIKKVGDKYLFFVDLSQKRADERLFLQMMCNDYRLLNTFSEDEPLLKELVTSLSK